MKIFIATANTTTGLALRLSHSLKERGFETWAAQSNVAAGENWASSIQSEIRNSDVMLYLINRESSGYGIMELAIAQASQVEDGKPKILPILAQKGAELPIAIREIQYIDMTNLSEFDSKLVDLFDAIERITTQNSVPANFDKMNERHLAMKELLKLEFAREALLRTEREKVIWSEMANFLGALLLSTVVGVLLGLSASNFVALASGIAISTIAGIWIRIRSISRKIQNGKL